VLPQGDDLLPQAILLSVRPGLSGRREEEFPLGVLPELVHQAPEAARRVAEASCRLDRGDAIDEIRPEGFVLPVGGVGRLEEVPRER